MRFFLQRGKLPLISFSANLAMSTFFNKPRLSITAAILFAAMSSATYASDPVIIPEAASGFRDTTTVSAKSAMAVTANPYATYTAEKILRAGGSAIDAGIAAQLVLGLVEPQSSGIGGGAFMLYWDASQKQLSSWDGRETAPQLVDENHFLTSDSQPMGFFDAVIGGYSVGVPGVLAMLEASHNKFGKLPWEALFAPAISLASNGFIVSPRLHTLLVKMPKVAVNPAIESYFFSDAKTPKPIGTVLKNPAYARALSKIASKGSAVFYKGDIANNIVKAVKSDPNRAGLLRKSDLANYKASERAPVCATFRSYKVCGAPPPSSGGTTVIAILKMIEAVEDRSPAFSEADFLHTFIEASRLAFEDRNAFVADPDFVEVPTAGLVDSGYLNQRAALIDIEKRALSVAAGKPPAAPIRIRSASPELPSTSHFSIVDANGNVLSMTSSIETAFGSRIFVDGFLLNNQLTDFSFTPENADGSKIANRIQAGKRPRSSMSPMIVFKDDKPLLAIGSPGGARIIDYVAASLYRILAEDEDIAHAISAGHVIAMGDTTELETGRFSEEVKNELQLRGHQFTERDQTSGLHGIVIKESGLEGAADPRREGQVLGF
ncbi:gamma-glutamyltransferase [Zhongshania arctica]|uniref:Glutathione hydrolase proenzyme n=1 Tax=Zhongshania arctica TaxID=3238302 RepID=A0ABV3TS12_9GAMM